ncbi:MAG: DUF6326 family protein [Myxococcota bacterium]
MITTESGPLADDLATRSRLAAAWASAMFLYAYADIIHFTLQPGSLEQIMAGALGGMELNGPMLFAAAALMTASSLMIVASMVLPPRLCRAINIGFGAFSTLLIPALALTGENWGYYYLFNAFEVLLTAFIVWVAIRWPRLLPAQVVGEARLGAMGPAAV